MLDTCYLHLEFTGRDGEWSVNLPFLCTKCGLCCKLDDFLTAGPIKATAQEQPEIHEKLKEVYDQIGELLDKKGQDAYDDYLMHTPCPFLKDKLCSIYEVRPEGCRMFPNTAFAMLSVDCEALERFKRQRKALRRGRSSKEAFHTTTQSIKTTKFSDKKMQKCLSQLQKVGITIEEKKLFKELNKIK